MQNISLEKTETLEHEELQSEAEHLKICSRCIYDENTPGIYFDSEGVCNYCKMVDGLQQEYQTGMPEGEKRFQLIVDEIKRCGKGKKYDCVVGVSGGTDSSYLLYKAVEYGLRPLAVHYDNTWNSTIATENIRKITKSLNVDLYTYVVDNKEMDDIYKAFFHASVPAIDVPTDIALAEVLYRCAAKNKVKYILEGHSYKTEGVCPVGYSYFDGKYIESIHKEFGKMKMKTFPNMKLLSFLKWITIKRIKKIRPFWYLNYSKEDAREFLQQKFGWQYYGGHHLENRMTAFSMSFHNPVKFSMDQRNNSLAALARNGRMSRLDALKAYSEPPFFEAELLDYLKKRLGFSDEEFEKNMKLPPKDFTKYKTYKSVFEHMRPFFWVMYKMNLVPKSFYIKYTSKGKI